MIEDLLAEATRLEAEAETLIAAATARGHAEGWLDVRSSLIGCAESRPLHYRAAELRREAAEAREGAEAAPAPDLTRTTAPKPQPVRTAPPLDRAECIRRIGASFKLSAATISAAIASGVTVEGFAVAQANAKIAADAKAKVIAAAAAAHAKAEAAIDARAQRIAAAGTVPLELAPSGNPELDALAKRIAAS